MLPLPSMSIAEVGRDDVAAKRFDVFDAIASPRSVAWTCSCPLVEPDPSVLDRSGDCVRVELDGEVRVGVI